MKIKEMFKKITAGIGIFFATVATKVFASTGPFSVIQPEYGISYPSDGPLYTKSFSFNILHLWQIVTIPIILILGIIIIVRKRKYQKIQVLKVALITAIIIHIVVDITQFVLNLLDL